MPLAPIHATIPEPGIGGGDGADDGGFDRWNDEATDRGESSTSSQYAANPIASGSTNHGPIPASLGNRSDYSMVCSMNYGDCYYPVNPGVRPSEFPDFPIRVDPPVLEPSNAGGPNYLLWAQVQIVVFFITLILLPVILRRIVSIVINIIFLFFVGVVCTFLFIILSNE